MKRTKTKLVSSIVMLLVCFAMLVGSTFAWFTDSASTGVNKIQAGNLDVEVDYSKDGTNWSSIEGTTSLFRSDLWEPGHTEYVYLKVKNAGNLALKYKVLVSPVSENGGINVDNGNFKLSDYLKFGTTTPVTSFTRFADRTAARSAIGDGVSIECNGLTKENKINAGEDDQYLALVVYMPETVGNEANAKPGTSAPSINLGIKVVATQVEKESDSFGNNYDSGAINDSQYVVGPTYNYFPQILKTAQVTESGDTIITAIGKLNATDDEKTLATVIVPYQAVARGVSELTVTVKPQAPSSSTVNNTTLVAEINDSNRDIANFEVKVEGIDQNNEAPISVEVYVGTGLANVKVYHNGSLIDGTSYNPSTGCVTFTTTSFSDFTVAYDAAAAAIGTKTYGSLELAVKNVKEGETITLLKNSAGNGIVVASGNKFTVNFNNYTYVVDGATVGSSGTETNGFQLLKDSILTFKNGTIKSSKAGIIIQNYSDLTLDNMVLDGSDLPNYWWNPCYVLSNNNGNVTIKDTTIITTNSNVAFDVCRYSSYVGPSVTVEGNSVINGKVEISSSGAKDGAVHQLNVTGGTFNGEIYKSGASPDFVGNITGGTFAYDPKDYLADGYEAVSVNGKFVVSEKLDVWDGSANADWAVSEDGKYHITSASDLKAFADAVNNGTSFANKTIVLDVSVDLNNKDWMPIGQTGGKDFAKTYFQGTFDGNEKTIFNLNIPLSTWSPDIKDERNESAFASGFFGFIDAGGKAIKNITFENATVEGHHWVGVAVGYMTGTVENVIVKNSNIQNTKNSNVDGADGDKAGGIVGYVNNGKITNCRVIDSSISAGRDAGQVVGMSLPQYVENCLASNVKVVNNGTSTGANIKNDIIGRTE